MLLPASNNLKAVFKCRRSLEKLLKRSNFARSMNSSPKGYGGEYMEIYNQFNPAGASTTNQSSTAGNQLPQQNQKPQIYHQSATNDHSAIIKGSEDILEQICKKTVKQSVHKKILKNQKKCHSGILSQQIVECLKHSGPIHAKKLAQSFFKLRSAEGSPVCNREEAIS